MYPKVTSGLDFLEVHYVVGQAHSLVQDIEGNYRHLLGKEKLHLDEIELRPVYRYGKILKDVQEEVWRLQVRCGAVNRPVIAISAMGKLEVRHRRLQEMLIQQLDNDFGE